MEYTLTGEFKRDMEFDENLVPAMSVLNNDRICVKYPPLVI